MILVTHSNKSVELLNNWYKCMVSHNIKEANKLNDLVTRTCNVEEEGQSFLLYYSLLKYRYHLLVNNEKTSLSINSTQLDHQLSYYYYFFQAIHFTKTGEFKKAKQNFILAESFLDHVIDDIEKAEFHYKVSDFYYNLMQPVLSTKHALIAKDLFAQLEGYELKVAGTENILGLNNILLGQYDDAENHFNHALILVRNLGEENIESALYSNLGFLYSEKGLPDFAIEYFIETFERTPHNFKNIFLLSREFFKVKKFNLSLYYVHEGLELVHHLHNEEYIHHFTILHSQITMKDHIALEIIINESMLYFEKEELYGYIEEYSIDLAKLFFDLGQHEKSSFYYKKAYDAKQKMKMKEIL